MKRILFLMPLFSFAITFSQDKELLFAKYLYEKGFYDNASLQLQLMRRSCGEEQVDSLTYYSGLCMEKMWLSDSAISLYNVLEPENEYYDHSRFRLALIFASKKNYTGSLAVMDSLKLDNACNEDLRLYFADAFSLLSKKSASKHAFSCKGTFSGKLEEYSGTLALNKRRSPFMGGLLSALIPGLGRVYAGKPRLALSSFIPIATFGLQAWEGYRKQDGFKSARFWVFGSVATLFYIGNIYGSALSVKIVKQERYDIVENQVMLDLRLSLRDLYGRDW